MNPGSSNQAHLHAAYEWDGLGLWLWLWLGLGSWLGLGLGLLIGLGSPCPGRLVPPSDAVVWSMLHVTSFPAMHCASRPPPQRPTAADMRINRIESITDAFVSHSCGSTITPPHRRRGGESVGLNIASFYIFCHRPSQKFGKSAAAHGRKALKALTKLRNPPNFVFP